MDNSRVLVISDQHFPYNHADIVGFLSKVKSTYSPNRVINIGDEIDYHSISFHDHNPNLLSPGDELNEAIKRLKPIYQMFPKVDVIESNHGSLVYRKGNHHGIPRTVFKSYREILEAPIGWKWHFDLTLKLSNGQYCYFHHGKAKNALKVSQAMGMSYCQGHYHESFDVQYWGNSLGLYWAMTVGCLINNDALAFSYNKTNLKRPIIGCGIIIDGHPKLLPLVMNDRGRWIGKLV